MLVYYYSHSGNVAALAATIADYYHIDSVELKPQKPYGKSLFFLQALGQTLFKKNPPLADYRKPKGEEALFICFPVWADNFAAPLNTFMAENNLNGRKIVLVSCSQRSEPEAAWQIFKNEHPQIELSSVKNFTTKEDPMILNRKDVTDWLKGLQV